MSDACPFAVSVSSTRPSCRPGTRPGTSWPCRAGASHGDSWSTRAWPAASSPWSATPWAAGPTSWRASARSFPPVTPPRSRAPSRGSFATPTPAGHGSGTGWRATRSPRRRQATSRPPSRSGRRGRAAAEGQGNHGEPEQDHAGDAGEEGRAVRSCLHRVWQEQNDEERAVHAAAEVGYLVDDPDPAAEQEHPEDQREP